jgi:AcrR family transcriptional regulator
MKKYSEKEIAIFEGVRQLMAQQTNMAQVTASDIAQAAGIGKGTLYNYFETKEDIIAETIFYVIEMQLGEVSKAISKETGFEEKLRAAFTLVGEFCQRRDSQIQLALAGMDNQLPAMEKYMPRVKLLFEQIEAMYCELVELGIREGVIASYGMDYAIYVLRSVMMGFCQPLCCSEATISREQHREWAYQMMIKALN